MTPYQWKRAGQLLTMLSGPVIRILADQFGVGEETVKPWLDLLAVVTMLGGGGWFAADSTQAATVLAAKSIPEVATIVVKDDAKGALAKLASDAGPEHIVTETQNERDAKAGKKA